MVSRFSIFLGTVLTLLLAGVAPSMAADANAPIDYVVIVRHAEINRPAAQAWKRVGGWCTLTEWLHVTCKVISGSGDLGSIRVIDGTFHEVMVSKSALSYTYWQTVGSMAPSGYHGTVAIVPDGPNRSTVVYTLVYNQDAFPTEAERKFQHERLTKRFQGACDEIKKLAEAQP